MKPVKNYILLVDSHRDMRSKYMKPRNTAGRYRVGAKTPEEAVKILREVIGFGSIRVYYEVIPGKHDYDGPVVGYKTVVQQIYDRSKPGYSFKYVQPHHATAPRETYVEKE